MQDVFTGPFGTSSGLGITGNDFDFQASIGPFQSLKMCPGNFFTAIGVSRIRNCKGGWIY